MLFEFFGCLNRVIMAHLVNVGRRNLSIAAKDMQREKVIGGYPG